MTSASGLERWQGCVALVTGASSGIGEAIAERLVQEGLRVVVWARRFSRLEALAERLGGRDVVWPMALDVRDVGAIASAFAEIQERWGGVDVLVNNAGLGHLAPLHCGDTEKWREILEVNVLALAVCTREAVQQMLARERAGHIFHISSMSGYRVSQNSGMYSASKFAVRSLTEGLRQELRELGSEIRVGAISPGNVETEFTAKFLADLPEGAFEPHSYPLLQAKDIAETLLFLLRAPAHMEVHDVLLRPVHQAS